VSGRNQYWPVVVCSLHTVFILGLASYVSYLLWRYDNPGETMPLWYLAWIVDFPSSLLAVFLESLVNDVKEADYQWMSARIAGIMLIVGGLQYYLLTRLTVALFSRWDEGNCE
jgi:hypothetical protein